MEAEWLTLKAATSMPTNVVMLAIMHRAVASIFRRVVRQISITATYLRMLLLAWAVVFMSGPAQWLTLKAVASITTTVIMVVVSTSPHR
jgi:hypothetical protein